MEKILEKLLTKHSSLYILVKGSFPATLHLSEVGICTITSRRWDLCLSTQEFIVSPISEIWTLHPLPGNRRDLDGMHGSHSFLLQ